MQFQVGDVVELKSGGPNMTVTGTAPLNGKPHVFVAWFLNGEPKAFHFPPEALKKVPVGANY